MRVFFFLQNEKTKLPKQKKNKNKRKTNFKSKRFDLMVKDMVQFPKQKVST